MDRLTVTVGAPVKRTEGKSDFMVFPVQTKVEGEPVEGFPAGQYEQWHRFSDFETLWRFLSDSRPAVVPPLPDKKFNFKLTKMSVDKEDPEFLAKRQAGLQAFMQRVLRHPTLGVLPAVIDFVTKEDWRSNLTIVIDGVVQPWNPSAFEERFKQLSVAVKLKNPDRRFTDVRHYADALKENLSNILTVHAKIAAAVEAGHKDLSDFSSTFNTWAGQEKIPFADTVHLLGLRFNEAAASGASTLEGDEPQVADPLREYVQFGDALKSVVARHEALLYDLERAQAAVEAKERDMDQVRKPTGARGLFASLRSTSEDEKAAKIETLAGQAAELKRTAQRDQDDYITFTMAALDDIQRFHTQKIADLRAIFLQYAQMQKAYALKQITHWRQIKNAATQ